MITAQGPPAEIIALFCCIYLAHDCGMIYGYARVSMDEQDLAVQRGQLEAPACTRIFSNTFTGTTT